MEPTLARTRWSPVLGSLAALAAGAIGAGCTPDPGKPQPVPSTSVSTSAPSATPTADASSSVGVAARRGAFLGAEGVAVDATGNVFVANTRAHTIVKVTPEGVLTTLAGSPGKAGAADGTGSAARFNSPSALAVGSTGDIYVADSANHTVRKLSPAGVVTTLAGRPGIAGDADGSGRAMRFRSPSSIAVDEIGNVFVGDFGNYTLRKVTAAGVGTTFAGRAGSHDLFDGRASGARFTAILGITMAPGGNLYVAEFSKLLGVAIRRVTPSGVVTTLSRSPGPEGAGVVPMGFLPDLGIPHGIAADTGGNLYISDHSSVIWKVTPAGVAAPLAGAPRGDSPGFVRALGLAVDKAGKVYVADSGDGSIRIISPEGAVTTLAVKQETQ